MTMTFGLHEHKISQTNIQTSKHLKTGELSHQYLLDIMGTMVFIELKLQCAIERLILVGNVENKRLRGRSPTQ